MKAKKTGYICPRTVAKQVKLTVMGLTSNALASRTGSNPFSISAINTMAAYFLPANRRTLVAPGFRDPEIRGSGREKYD